MFTIDEIIKATGGKLLQGPSKGKVKAVSIDSRRVKKGELFIAVKGDIFDGHDFIRDVIAKAVRIIVVHQKMQVDDARVSIILVKDTTRALGDVARFHRLRFKAPVIAITGSAGKTTTKEMIAAVLSERYKVLKNEGTQNNHIGVPLTLLKLKPSHQMVVLECGTNQPGDIPWLADVSRPDVAVFTNIGASHLEKLKTTGGVLKEKWALAASLTKKGVLGVNADDPLLSAQSKKIKDPQLITYGIDRTARWQARDIEVIDGCRLCFNTGGKRIEIRSCGVNNVYNALSAYACGILFKVPSASMARALKRFEFPKGRGQIMRLGTGWLINDTYNANPVSMQSAIQTLDVIAVTGKKIFVAADMLELGEKARALHTSVGAAIARSSVDVLITVGKLARLMAVEARRRNKKMRVFACADVEAAQKQLAGVLSNGDAVLIKGSRRMKMEQVSEFLLAAPQASLT